MTSVRSLRGGRIAAPRSGRASDVDDEVDDTLIDLMLELSISDRLRSLCRYANALARFRRV